MKRTMIVAFALLCGVAVWAAEKKTLTLEQAREMIAEVVKNPEKMGEVTAQLSAADQNAFVIEVNKAIAAMPGSNEQKTAKYLAVEREALLAAQKGNLQPLVATMFATVPLESLTVLAERYGDDLFNRSADATKTFTDEQFTEIASSTVGEVKKRCDGLADAVPRDVLAIYLFERASNGTIPELEDRLLEVAISDPQIRAVAKKEWLAAANGDGNDRFSALLGYADAGRAPNVDVTLRIAGPQVMTAMLADLDNGVTDSKGTRIYPITQGEYPTERGLTTGGIAQEMTDGLSSTRPVTSDPTKPWNPNYSRSNSDEKTAEASAAVEKVVEEIVHPGGYPYQN